MLSIFKSKPFDIDDLFATWTDAPTFSGKAKKDPPVEQWLDDIKAGCVARKVPEGLWQTVAEHYMGKKAIARLEEVKRVLRQMHGDDYHWTWKKFRLAMCNMGWDVDEKATKAIEIKNKVSGFLSRRTSSKDGKKERAATVDMSDWVKVPTSVPMPKEAPEPPAKPPAKSVPKPVAKKSEPAESKKRASPPAPSPPKQRRPPVRRATDSSLMNVLGWKSQPEPQRDLLDPQAILAAAATTVVNAPVWLLNACDTLDTFMQDNPKTMNALSAVLVLAGSIPATALTTGVGGAVLAGHTAQSMGAAALGAGSWLKARQEKTDGGTVRKSK